MSFGLDVFDLNGRKSFDHKRRVMKIYDHLKVSSSSFLNNNNSGLIDDYNLSKMATIRFNKVIKTKYPPILFARTKGTLIIATTRYIGSEFNWTGAYLGHGFLPYRWFDGRGTAVDNNSDFEVVVCGFESFTLSKSFGLQVLDEVGNTTFNTEDRVAVLKNVGLYGWEKYFEHASGSGGSGPYRYYFRKRVNMSQNDFFQMSGLCWGGIYFGSNFRQDVHGGIFKSDYNYLRYEIKGTFFGPGFDENPINYRSTMILNGGRIPWL